MHGKGRDLGWTCFVEGCKLPTSPAEGRPQGGIHPTFDPPSALGGAEHAHPHRGKGRAVARLCFLPGLDTPLKVVNINAHVTYELHEPLDVVGEEVHGEVTGMRNGGAMVVNDLKAKRHGVNHPLRHLCGTVAGASIQHDHVKHLRREGLLGQVIQQQTKPTHFVQHRHHDTEATMDTLGHVEKGGRTNLHAVCSSSRGKVKKSRGEPTPMSTPRPRLTGVDDGLRVRVSTRIRGADDPQRVSDAFRRLFPDAPDVTWPPPAVYPTESDNTVTVENVPLDTMMQCIRDQRILDTALDAMTIDIDNDTTSFGLERVAALAGKVAFGLPGHPPLGGTFEVCIEGPGLRDWLTAATHHDGRASVPRSIGDERAMAPDGEVSVWFER